MFTETNNTSELVHRLTVINETQSLFIEVGDNDVILTFRIPYQDIFGGVEAIWKEHFEKVNGFSNKYWGWGGEDDDLHHRCQNITINH